MAESTSTSPRIICGDMDERIQVYPVPTALPPNSPNPPYHWIAKLSTTKKNGDTYGGTGFKIQLPGVNYTAVVTAGHNLVNATKTSVTFPGQKPITSSDFYIAPEYTSSENDDYDYGLVLLPGNSDDGFGWSTQLTDSDLNNRAVSVCGYPGDKEYKTMWISGGNIMSHTARRIYYSDDTTGGESGSPVYTWYKGYWTVIGIHHGNPTSGECRNDGPRFILKMISRFVKRMNSKKALLSMQFSAVYVRASGSDLSSSKSIGGIVDCKYNILTVYEQFYIYPLEMPPSLAIQPDRIRVVIESAQSNNVFIRLDASKAHHEYKSSGQGTVDCHYGVKEYETYWCKKEDGNDVFSFISTCFPNFRIRVDGSGVNSQHTIGGTVNCQYYSDSDQFGPAGSYEKLKIVDA